jgi:small subunit ribosomal protein S16
MGRKKAPIYKIVAADSRSKRDGRFIEAIGQYDPNYKPARVEVQEERVLYWLKSGARPTVTVKNLLSDKGLMLKHRLKIKGADENKINTELTKWASVQEAKLQRANDKKMARKLKKKKEAEKPVETKAESKAEVKAEAQAEEPVAETVEQPAAEETAAGEKAAE